MAKMTALGIFHTPMGDYLVFPCGCSDGDNLNTKRQKASVRTGSVENGQIVYRVPQPVWMTFETDYIFEDRPHEVEVED